MAFEDGASPPIPVHVHAVTKRLKGGEERVYYYHRKTRRRIAAAPGQDHFQTAFNDAAKMTDPRRHVRTRSKGRFVGVVYFVHAPIAGRVKIGWAANAARRLTNLQVGSPERLNLLGTMPDPSGDLERVLHARFSATHSHGEWFDCSPDLMAFIRKETIEGSA